MSIENRDCHSETLLKICARYGLGKPEDEPAPLKGGFLHRQGKIRGQAAEPLYYAA